jgi:hypothetical protein
VLTETKLQVVFHVPPCQFYDHPSKYVVMHAYCFCLLAVRWYDDLADGMVHQQRRHPGDVEEQARRLAMAAIRARNPVSTAASCPSLNKRPRHH